MRIVVWSNFDVNFPIELPEDWLRFTIKGQKGLIRIRNRRGIQILDRSQSLEVIPLSSAERSPVNVEIRPSAGVNDLTSSKISPFSYYSESVMFDQSRRPDFRLELGPNAKEEKNLYYSQIDIVWSKKIPEGDWSQNARDLAFECTGMFTSIISHYRCISADILANPDGQDISTQKLWSLLLKPAERSSSHEDLERYVTDFSRFKGKTGQPDTPVVNITVPSTFHPRGERPEVAGVLSNVLKLDVPIPVHWNTLISGVQEYLMRSSNATAVIVCGMALELRVRGLVYDILIGQGKSPAEADEACEGTYGGPIRKLQYLNKELRSTKIDEVAEDKIEKWRMEMYQTRKRVAHEGYDPSQLETKIAIRATCALLDELEKVTTRRNQYALLDIGASICALYLI
ncbi:hypothetical protein [Alicyclobacillus fodiniaquatilis]|uniref:Apea-like HEPN domain-containing protein n=1 Tax=Alicyclobacillus fodiniaquatilis TaxID=1661150 RepID=A0ABW4JIY2_9BACL